MRTPEELAAMLADPFFGPLISDAWDTYNTKGVDYTRGLGAAQRTDNFQLAADFTGTTQYQTWLVYFYKHVAAVAAFCRRGGQVESEPIEGRLIDVINYAVLLKAIIDTEKVTPHD